MKTLRKTNQIQINGKYDIIVIEGGIAGAMLHLSIMDCVLHPGACMERWKKRSCNKKLEDPEVFNNLYRIGKITSK